MFSKPLTVYWCNPYFNITAFEPDTALIDFSERIKMMGDENFHLSSSIKYCPVATSHLLHTFRVKSPTKYNIMWDGKDFHSQIGTQNLFDRSVIVRNQNAGLLTFQFGGMLMFTEEASLMVEQRQASYSISDFTINTSVLEGAFDIGGWFRSFDCVFFINHQNKYINIEAGDSLYYLKFFTDRKIKFVKFNPAQEIMNIMSNLSESRNPAVRKKSLDYYYNLLLRSHYKKHIIKLIKQNILE